MLTSSNEKIKQTLGILTDKIEQMKQNIEMEKEKEEKERKERLEKNKKKGNKKDKNENIEKGPFAEQDRDIKEKQDLINNLSKENISFKFTNLIVFLSFIIFLLLLVKILSVFNSLFIILLFRFIVFI